MSGGSSAAADVAPATSQAHAADSDLPVASEKVNSDCKSPYQELLSQGKWNELVQLAEGNLSRGDSSEARVWWVRGHLGALSMPASFLAAPLEALCRKLTGSVLSVSLREALAETGPLLLKRLEDVSDSEQVLSLRAALERLGVIQSSEPKSEKQRRSTATDLRSISLEPFSLAQPHGAGNTPLLTDKKSSSNRQQLKMPRRWLAVVSVLLLVACGAAWWGVIKRSDRWWGKATLVASESFVPSGEAAEQLIPATDARGVVGSLSALFYSMKGQEQALGGELKSAADSTAAAGAAAAVKERVDTTGPIEGAGFKRDAAPRVDREQELRIEVVRPQLPAVNDSPSLKHEKPAVDVSRMGRVSHATTVYAAPNYKADILGRLEAGDKVMIEGNAGRWLRLRSRRGKGGYVLRDDVAELDG
jgi:hypothetical protein